MQQSHVSLATSNPNPVTITIRSKSFKKGKKLIKEPSLESIRGRIVSVLSATGCTGNFSLGFITHCLEGGNVRGELRFRKFDLQTKTIEVLAQSDGRDTRMKLWLSVPDNISSGDDFLRLIMSAHKSLEPDGLPLSKPRRTFEIQADGDDGQLLTIGSSEEKVVPITIAGLTKSDAGAIVSSSSVSTSSNRQAMKALEGFDELDSLAKIKEGLSERKKNRDEQEGIKVRLEEIQRTLDRLADEECTLQERLKALSSSNSKDEEIAARVLELQALLGTKL